MNSNPLCRVILAYGQYSVGAIIRPSGMLRDELLRRGFIKIIKPEDVAAPKAAVAASDTTPKRAPRPKAKAVNA